jgi:hypothetical protein
MKIKTGILLLLIAGKGLAQTTASGEPRQLLQKLAERYRTAAHLSFDVAYYYSADKTPAAYLDSLEGHFKMNGNHYWYEVAGTESLYSDQYAVVLYKEDKVMYLAKPAASVANPVSTLDNFLKADTLYTCRLVHQQQYDQLTIDFIGKGPYKRTDYFMYEFLLIRKYLI